MHRLAARTLVVLSLAGALAAGSLPAGARSSRSEHRGGKKALGEVVSFDPATSILVVDLTDGDELSAAVDPEARVKLEHRGRAKKKDSNEHGNPTRGSLEDLVPGAAVLRIKLEDDTVTKIRLRPARALPPAPIEGEDSDDEGDDGDAAQEGSDDLDDVADETQEDEDSDDDENPDEDESGDLEDALPPLPAP